MKISIITVCYNSELFIRTAIESVLAQSYPDIEYILVDGGSNDNTVSIIKEYGDRFSGRMKWTSGKDNGLYDAMNKGIRMTTGDVVGILNSDDFYHRPTVIAEVAEAFADNAIQVTFGDVRFVNPQNLDKTVRYYSSQKFSPKLFRFGFMPAHPTFFTYKKYFDEFGYYKLDYKIAADYELLIRFLFIHKLNYAYLPIDVMKMRTGGKSTASMKSNLILNQEIVRACRENGIYTILPLMLLKYVVKVFELINTK